MTTNFATIIERLAPFRDKLRKLEQEGTFLFHRQIEGAADSSTQIEGRNVVLLASNNYLGLANHPRVVESVRKGVGRFGFGSGSSRVLAGTMTVHRELEEKLAWFKGTEDCLLYSTGYMANLGVICGLARAGDAVIVDALDHASIIDGVRQSGARMRNFPHGDINELRNKLRSQQATENKLVVVDAVYSMDGDVCDLPSHASIAAEENAIFVADDAHGTGVLGATGRGTCEHFGLTGKIDVMVGTLSKALGGVGGFAVGSRDIISFLRESSRPYIFNTSLPPVCCIAASTAIDVLIDEPQRLQKLRQNADYLRNGLKNIGFDTLDSQITPIIPVLIGDEQKLMQIVKMLLERSIMTSPVMWPACKPNASRIRMSVMATHEKHEQDLVLDVMKDAFTRFGPFDFARGGAAEDFVGLRSEATSLS